VWQVNTQAIDCRYHAAPTIDGIISPGEWSGVDSIILTNFMATDTTIVYFMHDGSNLYVGFDARYTPVSDAHIFVDIDHDEATAPQTDDRWYGLIMGERHGTGSGWDPNTTPPDGWTVDSSSGESHSGVEFKFEYEELGIVAGNSKTLGIGIKDDVTGNWPSTFVLEQPNTWGDISSSDNWQAVGSEEIIYEQSELEICVNPNPFANQVVIQLNAKVCSNISIQIYDITGKLIREFSSSSDRFIWDGTHNNGEKVPTGIYFCKLQTGRYKTMKKLILLH
jgi:hypothetical protein